jgi:hypothetical protein
MLIKPAQKHLITFTFAGISTFNTFNRVLAQTNTEDIIKQSDRAARSLTDRYSAENITQVQQLRDLSPSDWSYEAVRNLTERYGYMREFPDGTFQGDRSISRYEFAISFTGEDELSVISPSDRLNLAFTYIHSRDRSDTDMGSDLSNLQSFTKAEFDQEVPTVSDSYGAEFSYELSEFLVIGGWGGLSKVTISGESDRGTQDVWNWAINFVFPDLGKEGNLGGIVIGAEP